MIIFIILSGIYIITKNKFLMLVALQSFIIGMINILPIESLDGGEAVGLILHKFFSYENAKKISNVLSLVFLVPATFFGIFLGIKSRHNISVIMLALYLIFEKYFYV
ncbi:MAG: site-2 protease family protein [Clostridia bacterium]|nr:site-2 protease family protein [Clostridia bacterium]